MKLGRHLISKPMIWDSEKVDEDPLMDSAKAAGDEGGDAYIADDDLEGFDILLFYIDSHVTYNFSFSL